MRALHGGVRPGGGVMPEPVDHRAEAERRLAWAADRVTRLNGTRAASPEVATAELLSVLVSLGLAQTHALLALGQAQAGPSFVVSYDRPEDADKARTFAERMAEIMRRRPPNPGQTETGKRFVPPAAGADEWPLAQEGRAETSPVDARFHGGFGGHQEGLPCRHFRSISDGTITTCTACGVQL